MTQWAGWLIAFFGAAHTLGALTVEGAAGYAGAWFSGRLWGEDLAAMSPANSAYWLSLASFGVPFVLIGLTVAWLGRRDITPPSFIAWTLGSWIAVDAVVLGVGVGQGLILVLAVILLAVGIRRERRRVEVRGRASAEPGCG